ncbi:homeobox KN domain-containing protein [Glomus cerebriforme]|uniref:Homeobox KN domain-containing protein n=1 Tax=Glomus cerebriforme TaxID=658196 RepID=A0A397T6Z4_9GLOM|nr:homeobox KN domain-containing protein [Glomus cerebriforme]
MNRVGVFSLNIPAPFPTLKQDKLRTFAPIILFHEPYKTVDANASECNRINCNDEHNSELLKSVRKRVDNLLLEGSRNWQITSANSKDYELYGREHCHRQTIVPPPPIQLANTIYSHQASPQDQIENLSIKPKRRRGNLPKATTAHLKEWLAQHKKHPYPTEEEKLLLAKDTNLSLQQISNWFINARRRHLPHLLGTNDFVNGKGSSQSPELDIFPYEASETSAEDSDNNGLRRHASKCSARINKAGSIKKPYMRNKRKMSSV